MLPKVAVTNLRALSFLFSALLKFQLSSAHHPIINHNLQVTITAQKIRTYDREDKPPNRVKNQTLVIGGLSIKIYTH